MTELIEKFTASLRQGSSYDPRLSSLTAYRFTPHPHPLTRLETCDIYANDVDGRLVIEIDNYFREEECESMRRFSENAKFSRNIYGSPEAMEAGEIPAKMMDHFESLTFFTIPPLPILEVYRFLSGLGHNMNATITTLPWDLVDNVGPSSPTFATNFLRSNSRASMELGIHADSEPEKGVPYTIPKLYAPGKTFPHKFTNGARGNPLIVTLMLYACAENFLPQYLLGTLYYDKKREPVYCTSIEHMRMVLFESDILHTVQESNIPEQIDTWRVSYVFKLLINPHAEGQCLRSLLEHELYGKHG